MAYGIEQYVSASMKRRLLQGDVPHWMRVHPRSQYIIDSFLAAPLWMHRRHLRQKREEALRLTRETGRPHVLDHDIPITHPFVCGLTVPWNIVVLPRATNASKSNKWHPDQQHLEFPPQIPLFRQL